MTSPLTSPVTVSGTRPARATNPAEPALPQIDVDVEVDEETLRALVPPWRVVLHNDDHNTMEHVVASLVRSVPSLTVEDATAIMFEAHHEGAATVIECPKEAAEHYRESLESCGLTATIEAV